MSIVFNDTTNHSGLVQQYEKECGFTRGFVSGDTNRLKEFTADVNVALDDFMAIAIPASGNWAFDDTNHDDYPIITTNIVSGQQDYTFLEDADGSMILDIYKVVVSDSQGNFTELQPIEVTANDHVRDHYDISAFYDGQTHSGTPTTYAKTGNGIFLNSVPDYDYAGGLKLYVNREASYFSYSDTTKKPGVPGLFHKYFYLKPAREYARRNDLASYPRLEAAVIELEGIPAKGIRGAIQRYFGARERDITKRMRPAFSSNR